MGHVVRWCLGINKKPEALSVRRICVILMTFAAVILTVVGNIKESLKAASVSTGTVIGLVLISVAVGFSIPFQAMLNRIVTAEFVRGSFFQAVWWSFLEGFTVALIVLTVELCLDPTAARAFPARYADSEWYMYLGGPLGVFYVFLGAVFTGIIGFEAFFVSLVTGQLVASLVVQSYGLLTISKAPVGPLPIVGIVLVIVAVAVHAVVPKQFDYIVWKKQKVVEVRRVHVAGRQD
jgi:uncharacterized membrane protein YdcZ (DUF606 family)